jgi:hypothetical protein
MAGYNCQRQEDCTQIKVLQKERGGEKREMTYE